METPASLTFEHRFDELFTLREFGMWWSFGTAIVVGFLIVDEASPSTFAVLLAAAIAILGITLRNWITVVVRADAQGVTIIRECALNYFTSVEKHRANEIKCMHYRSDIKINEGSSVDQLYIQYELALERTDGKWVRIYSRRDEYLSRGVSEKLAEALGVAYAETLPEMPRHVPALSSRGKKNSSS